MPEVQQVVQDRAGTEAQIRLMGTQLLTMVFPGALRAEFLRDKEAGPSQGLLEVLVAVYKPLSQLQLRFTTPRLASRIILSPFYR